MVKTPPTEMKIKVRGEHKTFLTLQWGLTRSEADKAVKRNRDFSQDMVKRGWERPGVLYKSVKIEENNYALLAHVPKRKKRQR